MHQPSSPAFLRYANFVVRVFQLRHLRLSLQS